MSVTETVLMLTSNRLSILRDLSISSYDREEKGEDGYNNKNQIHSEFPAVRGEKHKESRQMLACDAKT
ncbi:hypothetical protein AAFF_G00391700 [Aldrovandia affinis]|uniref:Uncharacterized protein n=1 Tax=Aldrovandia affinis TaxID=143900 RepID=A0AAD7SDY8_9TELE|nr:hypothetical protein AAFF_G00391700 [Aldrovandia affinis]